MSEIRPGDKVRVKVDETSPAEDMGGIMRNEFNKYDYIHATVKSVSDRDIVLLTDFVEEPHIHHQKVAMKSITNHLCENCGGELVHHDKREKWICPFCDIDE